MAAPKHAPAPAIPAGTQGLPRLRSWQRAALTAYRDRRPRDFLVTATPGAGKTTFALALARMLVDERVVDRVIVVCPTDHLRTQWADAADQAGLPLDAALSNAVGPGPARPARLRHHVRAGGGQAGAARGPRRAPDARWWSSTRCTMPATGCRGVTPSRTRSGSPRGASA